ncbi:protein NRT1/ PTR FAMILY 5.1 isoform X2 [Cryptomeria japonica]|nr:protein NRT1/ PTR FAMILY 5.1 isoform X2 [Cryptomeria japonica]
METHQTDKEYTMDGSVDLWGKGVERAKTGRWRACSFLIGYEAFERMAFYGIASNLVIYLTKELHEGTVSSARNVNNWTGAVWLTPILGAYISDTYFGRYWTFLASSIIYLLGMVLLTLAVSLKSLKPPHCGKGLVCQKANSLQIGFFYFSLYVLAIGTGGTKPNISTFGADQFDDFHPKEKLQKNSFFNWWMFTVFFGALVAQTALVYVQENVGWALGYGIPTVGLFISLVIFMAGTPFYRHKVRTQDSPIKRVFRVLVSAISKWRVPAPDDVSKLHELNDTEYQAAGKRRIFHSPALRFLDKAAMRVESGTNGTTPRLCTVTEVEETKRMIGMVPVWVATVIPSTVVAQVNTLFVKQGTTLERHVGPGGFEIPAASLSAFITLSMLIAVPIYDRHVVPLLRRHTGNPRGITMLQRMGIGCAVQILVMVFATLTEAKRVHVIRQHGLEASKDPVPMSILWLLPQYSLMGVTDVFVVIGMLDFFYDQSPVDMQSLGTAFFTTSLGIGNFVSSFLLTTIEKLTGRNGHKSWITNNLNDSHLDYYYACIAILCFLNMLLFIFVAKLYVYKEDTSTVNNSENKGSNKFNSQLPPPSSTHGLEFLNLIKVQPTEGFELSPSSK